MFKVAARLMAGVFGLGITRSKPHITEHQRWAAFPKQDLMTWLDDPPPAGPVRPRRVAPWRRLRAKPVRRNWPAVALIGASLSLVTGWGARAAELHLDFPDLKPAGQVAWAVHASEEGWRKRGAALRSGFVPAGGSVTLDLPAGDYGVMAYHDRNSDRKLNTLPVGLPTEPYGFSNDARAPFGPPSWTAARFRLSSEGVRQTIRLR